MNPHVKVVELAVTESVFAESGAAGAVIVHVAVNVPPPAKLAVDCGLAPTAIE